MFTIYTREYCGYCTAAKKLLNSNGLDYKEIPLTEDTEEEFNLRTNGAKKVPQIFHDDKLIGGHDQLVEYLKDF